MPVTTCWGRGWFSSVAILSLSFHSAEWEERCVSHRGIKADKAIPAQQPAHSRAFYKHQRSFFLKANTIHGSCAEPGRGEIKPRGVGSLAVSGFCPPQTFHFTSAFCFVSQVAPDPLGSPAPGSASPARTVVPTSRSVLVVARGGQWARARWDTTFPVSGRKQQPPSNVWAPPMPGAGCWPPLPCCLLSLGPQDEGSRRQMDALTLSSLHVAECSLECCGVHREGVHW